MLAPTFAFTPLRSNLLPYCPPNNATALSQTASANNNMRPPAISHVR